jgi:hypothetical protein
VTPWVPGDRIQGSRGRRSGPGVVALLVALVPPSGLPSQPQAALAEAATYRPEYRHGWGSRTYYSQMRIAATSRDGGTRISRHAGWPRPLWGLDGGVTALAVSGARAAR